MANRISDRMVKAFERFNADLKAFGEETGGETFVTLLEDAFTTRRVANFRLHKNGNLKWIEIETGQLSREEVEPLFDDDAKEWLSFWRANLRRAKRYWATDAETLDKIQEGEIQDKEDEED